MAISVNLNDISNTADIVISPTEADLAATIETLGPNTTAAELLKFQAKLTINSTITATFSALMKERGDTLKGIVQKF
jgi:hypothetical protein